METLDQKILTAVERKIMDEKPIGKLPVKQADSKIELVALEKSSPEYAFHVANELKKFVTAQQLTVQIQSKPYAMVEAWQFCGMYFGLQPFITEVKNESTYQPVTFNWVDKYKNAKKYDTFHYKYRVTVELRRYSDHRVEQRAEMVCTNEEYGKHEFAEYAIQSMAQTRAIGKAFRLTIGYVMKAAGFEATPYEEMSDELQEYLANCPTAEEKKELVKLAYNAKYNRDDKIVDDEKKTEALAMIAGCTDYNLFNRIEARLKLLQPTILETTNPTQGQINEHLKRAIPKPTT